MKLRLFLASLLIALFASPFVHSAEDTPLEKEMSDLNKAFRQLKKQAADSTLGQASLPLVAQMEKAATASIALVPEKAADLPEGSQAAFIADYKEKMQAMVATLTKLETALKAGNTADAAKLVAELGAMQRAGHKEYRKPKD
ncbi:MAG TPA: cytochrome b562 [Rariglobus sp.]